MKGIIKIRQSHNERVHSINNDDDIKHLFPDFIFREKHSNIIIDNFN